MIKSKICTYQELKHKRELMTLNEWRYLQLRHFVTTLPQPIRSEEELFPFELCNLQMISKHYISWIYTILTESAEPRIPPFIERWEKDTYKRATIKQSIGSCT